MFNKLLLILAGLAIFLYGVEGPLLDLMGTEAIGQVTAVEAKPSTDASSVRDWKVTYRFSAGNGTSVTGVENRNQVYNTRTLPQVGSTIRVKYLKAIPTLNAPAYQAGLTAARIVATALGLLLVVLGVRETRRGRRVATQSNR